MGVRYLGMDDTPEDIGRIHLGMGIRDIGMGDTTGHCQISRGG